MNFLKKAAADVQNRANTTVEAKKLLDDGGPPMEAYLSTKGNMRSAVQSETVVLAQCTDTLHQYEAVLEQMNKTISEAGTSISEEQKNELTKFIPIYQARVKACKTAIDALVETPPAPAISPVEDDAIKMLFVKGKVEDVKKRSQEVADKAMTKVQGNKNTQEAPAPAAP
uniref:Uncharacterized protein n=1 Tax=Aureoumbra lagunensis TaxID=44058 RepID=A0A7S3K5Q5_9STRA